MHFCPKCRDDFQDWVKVCPDCGLELVAKLEPVPKKVKPVPPPHHDLITITTFNFPTEAYLASAKLESEGIWSFVADENIGLNYAGAFGGVKLLVSEGDVKRAKNILRVKRKKSQNKTSDEERCPKCKSANIHYETFNIRLAYIFMVILGLIFPFLKRTWKCNDCGYQWKDKP